ncbi:MAG: AMP-binding protein [Burkholderiales bacterium]
MRTGNAPAAGAATLSVGCCIATSASLAGTPIPPAVAQATQERLGVTVVACWGITECCSVTMTPPRGYKVLESDGCALDGAEVRIVDERGSEVPRGVEGTLQIRGAALFVGYRKRPQLYALDPDGWFDTGDVARMDDEGYIRICGRNKDIVIRGGEDIPVIAVESALYRMPEIADVAIVTMPDPRLIERACPESSAGGRSERRDVMQVHGHFVPTGPRGRC